MTSLVFQMEAMSGTGPKVDKDAAAMLRRVVEAVETGDLDAPPGPARKLLAHMEGAATALEVAAGDTKPTKRAQSPPTLTTSYSNRPWRAVPT